VVIVTDQQLMLLSKAKTWYVDGTFKVVGPPFKQLFSIHAYVSADNTCQQVPLVTCLLRSCLDARLSNNQIWHF